MPGRRRYELKQRQVGVEQTRLRITEAAVELHSSLGPSRATVSDIARHAGVDRATVYRHFPDSAALFRACSSHFAAANPLPDPERWRTIGEPRTRLERALRDVYAYYERAEPLLANVVRDAETMPEVRAAGAYRRAWLAGVEDELAAGWEGETSNVRAALAIALDFRTWQHVTRGRGLSRGRAVHLAVAMVAGAACG